MAMKDLAFLLANLARDLFRDGSQNIALAALSFSIDLGNVVGFVAFTNVDIGLFDSIGRNTAYQSTPSCQNSFFTTSPLNHRLLDSPYVVAETLAVVRRLAQV
ncbi:hypothetical protein BT96DRAFT_919673 [Gymnopus androsaceus JB14]|uniref:Uncharacterized protein n=1 Tax=Gymnopus androsaceus JB14 TaxID=1447944 RepID=A0A6A4HPW4_9AGAR|nr:hypothetical protein BT96DRAFT_919673 [Gymnopus androsaceus JB14]